jgi:heptosyltransferase-1
MRCRRSADMLRALPGAEIDWLVETPLPPFRRCTPAQPGACPAWRKWRRQLRSGATWRPWRRCGRAARAALRPGARPAGPAQERAVGAPGLGPVAGYDSASAREAAGQLAVPARPPCRARCTPWSAAGAWPRRHLGYAACRHRRPTSACRRRPRPGAPRAYAVLIPNASRPRSCGPSAAGWRSAGAARPGLDAGGAVGQRAEQTLAERIAAGCDGEVPPFLKVGEMAAVLAGRTSIVGLDTGFTHLGAAWAGPPWASTATTSPAWPASPGRLGCTASGARARCPSVQPTCWRCWSQLRACSPALSRAGRASGLGGAGPLLFLDALRRVAVPAQAARALPEIVLGLEAAGRAAVALHRPGGCATASRRPAGPRLPSASGRPAAGPRPPTAGLLRSRCCSSRSRGRRSVPRRPAGQARSRSMPGLGGHRDQRVRAGRLRPPACAAVGVVGGHQREGSGLALAQFVPGRHGLHARPGRARRWPVSTSGRAAGGGLGARSRAWSAASASPRVVGFCASSHQ